MFPAALFEVLWLEKFTQSFALKHLKVLPPGMKNGSWPPELQPFCTSAHPLGWSKILQRIKTVGRETSHCNLLNCQPGEPLRLPRDETWSGLFHSPALGAEFKAHCVSDLCKLWHTISSCVCCFISWKVERLGRICGIFTEVYWTYGVQAGLSC